MLNNNSGVFSIRQDENNNNIHYLEPKMDKFKLPTKLYGNLDILAKRFWTTFATSNGSLGVILTGESGSGKTELSNVVGNIAIQNNMYVVLVSEIEANIETIRFIDTLDRCVIIFDEFGKVFNHSLQEKMLTLLNNLNNSKKLYILTENDANLINMFIRNRPGRALYHIDFKRMDAEDIEEYCSDYNVDQTFYDDLIATYNSSTVFSFDHLQALVKEHLRYPQDSFEYILNILNLDILSKKEYLSIITVYDVKTKEDVECFELPSIKMDNFNKGWNTYLNGKEGERIMINKSSVVNINGDTYTLLIDKTYKVILTKETE